VLPNRGRKRVMGVVFSLKAEEGEKRPRRNIGKKRMARENG
jgi:hypothetical protein